MSASRRPQLWLRPAAISLAAVIVLLSSGLLVNGCQINKLLSSTNASAIDEPLAVTPSEVKDSALVGTTTARNASLVVTNGGGWAVATASSWIHFTPSTGSSHGTVRLSLIPKDLSPGMHKGQVTVRQKETAGDSVTVAVNFLIQQPILSVNTSSLNYTARKNSAVFRDTIRVSNSGTGPLNWTAAILHGADWLTIDRDSGTGSGKIAVRASAEDLPFFGTFRDTIVVTAPGAKNSPARIAVSLKRKGD